MLQYDLDKDGKLTYAELYKWAEDHRDLTALMSWIFDERGFAPAPLREEDDHPTRDTRTSLEPRSNTRV